MKSARLIHTGYGVWIARPRRKRAAVRAARSSWLRVDVEEEAKLRRLLKERWAADERRQATARRGFEPVDSSASANAASGIPPFLGRAAIYVAIAAFATGYVLLG